MTYRPMRVATWASPSNRAASTASARSISGSADSSPLGSLMRSEVYRTGEKIPAKSVVAVRSLQLELALVEIDLHRFGDRRQRAVVAADPRGPCRDPQA